MAAQSQPCGTPKSVAPILIMALALAGCQRVDANVKPVSGDGTGSYVRIWTDPDTGCEFYYTARYGIAGQRFNADGSPRCKLVVRADELHAAPDPQGRAPDLTGKRQ